jgi:hypothetical protein
VATNQPAISSKGNDAKSSWQQWIHQPQRLWLYTVLFRGRLEEQCGWAADLLKGKWRDSLDGVTWNTETRDLQSLLTHHKIDCEVAHRAGPDARALLELLSYGGSGKTYLAQLMSEMPDTKA